MKKTNPKCFLGANSAEGFVSRFADCYDPYCGWSAYIIKGGPGTGKSTFMRGLIERAEENNIEAVEVYCASDPKSLDGVILPTLKTVVMDGTSPHIVEPVLPGVCDGILDFGSFWDAKMLKSKSGEIISATRENKALHKSAARYICGAGKVMEEILSAVYSPETAEKAAEQGAHTIKSHISPKGESGRLWEAFICGVTPSGVASFADSIPAQHRFAVKDPFGAVSEAVLSAIKNNALDAGYEVINFKNPILPSKLTDGVLIPELSLFAVREYDFIKLNSSYQSIPVTISENDFEKEIGLMKELLHLAAEKINSAKTVHDRLEEHYISAMDFAALNAFGEEFYKKLFG